MRIERHLAGQVGIVDYRRFPVERQTSLGRRMTNAVKAPHKVQMPRGAAELAVCNGMIAGFLLLVHQIHNRLVFDGLQRGGVDLSGLKVQTCLLQLCRAQKAADMIITKGRMFFAHEKRSFIYFYLFVSSVQSHCIIAKFNRQIQLYIVKLPIFTAGKSCIIPNVDKSEDQDTRVCGTFHVCGTILRKCRLFG